MLDWQHQSDEPLFPDVVWSKPETAQGSGKLLLIGGSAGAMSHVAASFAAAERAGVGTLHMLVPDALAKVTKGIPFINYAPSTPSGSFAKKALSDFLDISSSVDGVLLAGDLGKNSETSLLLEQFSEKYQGFLTVSSGALDSFPDSPDALLQRSNTCIFLNFHQLQQIGILLKLPTAILSSTGKPKFAEILRDISNQSEASLIINYQDTVWVVEKDRVVDGLNKNFSEAKTVVWAIQQPEKRFEAIVSSLID